MQNQLNGLQDQLIRNIESISYSLICSEIPQRFVSFRHKQDSTNIWWSLIQGKGLFFNSENVLYISSSHCRDFSFQNPLSVGFPGIHFQSDISFAEGSPGVTE